MLALLISFLVSILTLNTLPLPESFAPEARIFRFLDQTQAVASDAGKKVKGVSVRSFPQLHLQDPPVYSREISSKYNHPWRNNSSSFLKLNQGNAAVWGIKSGSFLWEKKGEEQVPLASITKLMTALVFLEHNPGWDKVYEVQRKDRREGGRIHVYLGDKIEIKELFNLSLVASANTATMGLVHSTGMTEEEFVREMNKKAEEIGLVKTRFQDPVGLDSGNVSTPKEAAQITKRALSHQRIQQATLKGEYSFTTEQGDKRQVDSTDRLLDVFPYKRIELLGGKTGYTPEAGYCFVGKFRDPQGHEIISVILNTESEKARFEKTKQLVEWVYDSYSWE